MSIREELPNEMTKEEKVTGTADSSAGRRDAAARGSFSDEAGAEGGSVAPVPRRSRMTNPSSLSPAILFLFRTAAARAEAAFLATGTLSQHRRPRKKR